MFERLQKHFKNACFWMIPLVLVGGLGPFQGHHDQMTASKPLKLFNLTTLFTAGMFLKYTSKYNIK